MQKEDLRLSTTGGGVYLPRASNQWEENLPIAKATRLEEINDGEVISRLSSISLHSNHQHHHVWRQIGDAGCNGIVFTIVIAIVIAIDIVDIFSLQPITSSLWLDGCGQIDVYVAVTLFLSLTLFIFLQSHHHCHHRHYHHY